MAIKDVPLDVHLRGVTETAAQYLARRVGEPVRLTPDGDIDPRDRREIATRLGVRESWVRLGPGSVLEVGPPVRSVADDAEALRYHPPEIVALLNRGGAIRDGVTAEDRAEGARVGARVEAVRQTARDAMASAPIDDEPTTDDDRAALAEGRALIETLRAARALESEALDLGASAIACAVADAWVQERACSGSGTPIVQEGLRAALDRLEAVTRPSAMRKVRP